MDIALIVMGIVFLLFLGMPVAFSLSTVALTAMFLMDLPLGMIPHTMYGALDKFIWAAIPLFMLMGQILLKGGIGEDLFDFVNSLVRHFRGGLSIAAILSCTFFAAVTGSSASTALTVGVIAIPAMINRGYSKKFVYGVIAAGGTLGILIPPSGPMILYGGMTDVSVGKLFIAGIIPGLFIAALFILYAFGYNIVSLRGTSRIEKATWRERAAEFKRTFWSLWLPPVVIGGIYLGIFTPTESAGIGVLYSFILVYFVYRRLRLIDFIAVFRETVLLTCMLFLIIASAILFGHVISLMQVPQKIAKAVIDMGLGPIGFIILINCIFIFMGDFLDPAAIILITVPIIFPIIEALNIDPIWFAIIMVVNLELSCITPPVGLNLYIILGISPDSKLGEILLGTWPFMLLLVLSIVVFVIFPDISLWLPGLMR